MYPDSLSPSAIPSCRVSDGYEKESEGRNKNVFGATGVLARLFFISDPHGLAIGSKATVGPPVSCSV